MNPMFRKGRSWLIFVAIPLDKLAIWVCMYWNQVAEDHRPIFWIVVSVSPWSLRAMAPPAWRECVPIRSGSMPWCCSLRYCAPFCSVFQTLVLVTDDHVVSVFIAQSSMSSLPPWDRMWWTRLARAATAPFCPVVSWCMVWPMWPFFWLDILSVAQSALTSSSSGDLRASCLLSLKNPTLPTLNWRVCVACFHCPLTCTFLGEVYSPTWRR